MLNDRLADELLALESIYPGVTWHERNDGQVDLDVTIKIDFESDLHAVTVIDLDEDEPAPPRLESATPPRTRAVEQANRIAGTSDSPLNRNDVKGARKRGAQNGMPSAQSSAPPPPPPDSIRRGPTPRSPSSNSSTNSENLSAPVRAETRSIPLSHSKNPRISIVLRPRSPPPPVREITTAIDQLEVKDRPIGSKTLSLRHLPSLHLRVTLPPTYPETAGPSTIDLQSEGSWLPERNRACAIENLSQVYAGDECLFGILELLSCASPDFLSTLSLSTPIVLEQESRRARPSSRAKLSQFLVEFDREASSTAFSTSSHLCPLCFAPRRGSNCIRLESCGCTFCVPCLREFYSLLITEGMVRSVACPSLECVEKRSKWDKANGGGVSIDDDELDKPGRVTADEVERLCGRATRERFEWLKEKTRIEADPTISFCPREACQAPTPKLGDDDKLRVCQACDFAYCVFCRKGWHGTRNACALPQSNAIVERYQNGDDDERRVLESKYGAANVRRLVAAFEEEKALQEWFDKNSQECPGCAIRVEKSHGCNHMTCGKCRTHFCYRCGKSISPTEPYRHFNTPSSICYGKLFDFAPGQEPPVEEWIGELVAQEGDHLH
ncbi:hypothetical protein JCM3766R1_004537 [Sporobolomyces carnicolor]